MLAASHDYLLVAASLAVALMSGFTGLSLTHGLAAHGDSTRKLRIVIASLALGGGIWAMHFIAMLGIRLPISFYYDTLITLASALVAMLFVGAALLLLHFVARTKTTLVLSGVLIATGILSMHYLGMSGMRLCKPVYEPLGVVVAMGGGGLISVGVVWTTYSRRTRLNLLLGSVIFGVAVFSTHFLAMAGTSFVAAPWNVGGGLPIDNATLAIGVTLISFAVCGGFLLMSVHLLPEVETTPAPPVETVVETTETRRVAQDETSATAPIRPKAVRVPYELQGRTEFIDHMQIAAIRAEGRYSILFVQERRLFCPWSLSEIAKRLPASEMVQTHRSYLVNPAFITGFERKKDCGYCYVDGVRAIEKVPVSRSRLAFVRDLLNA